MILRNSLFILGLAITAQFGIANVEAQDFYKGKTIRLIVATTPGGGFDAYSRAITRHMGKHLPGNPSFVVENMPGAGFLIGTNYLYHQAKPDGLTLGNWIGTLVLHQVIGRKGVEFDARRFEYVGAPIKNHDLCLMTRASGISSAEKWMASPIPVKMGATPPGSTPYDNAAILKDATGLPMQIVSGYKGTAEIRLAIDAGEVAGLCGLSWASTKVTWRKQLDSGEVKVVLQNSTAPHPDLPDVPLAINLAKTDMGRRLIQVALHDVSAITYLYSFPPNTPKERVQIFRQAFRETLKDAEFQAEAKKGNLELDPVAGEELEKIVNSFFKADPATVNRLRELLK
ncbi:MAG TPA: tripartite tricarboxylate transporter substrate-binding protein [Candidatus Binatia bacterium]|nr:tripartite tricarboxylate transporter substrate-binding protein [Candidatus Binatia bacterium]